jgi:hypothetical protein
MKTVEIGYQLPELKPYMIAWWIDTVKQQHMLSTAPDVNKLVFR